MDNIDDKKDLINNIIRKNLDINNTHKINFRNINNLNNYENININEQITINIENNLSTDKNEEIRQKYFNDKKSSYPIQILCHKKNIIIQVIVQVKLIIIQKK